MTELVESADHAKCLMLPELELKFGINIQDQ